MSARGLCNQELSAAAKLLELAGKNAALYPAAARQLYFCYQCFLLELAELHQLPGPPGIQSAADLVNALRARMGADADIAELESVERTDWLRILRSSAEPVYLSALAQRPAATTAGDNSIKVVEVLDNQQGFSAEVLRSAQSSLIEWISRARELNQEY